jgi:LPS-assembly protein
VPQLPRPARRFAPALSFLLAYGGLAVADDLPTAPDIVPGAASAPPPTCALGVLKCPKRKVDFSMCTKNDLLDTYVPGLPTDGDRSLVKAVANANRVSSSDAQHYLFEGDAEIQRFDQFLRAQTIRYDAETTDYDAVGNVRYQDRGMVMAADSAKGNADLDQCTLDGSVRYQLLSSRGNGSADTIVMDDKQHAKLTNSTYSTCNLSDQQWSIRGKEMTLDQNAGEGVGRDVTFRVHDVPIFWLPYMSFPLDDRRESGFLYPDIGYSDRRGMDVSIPYYFNLAPNYDATLTPRLMTDRGLMLGGEFRYLTDIGVGAFNFEALPNDRGVDDENLLNDETLPDDRWWYKWTNTTGFNENWSAGINLNRASDKRYFEDFGRGLYTSAISFLPSSAYLYGHGSWWNASIGGDTYQITDPTIADQYEPYHRLPRLTFNGENPVLGDFTAGINSEFIKFGKDHAIEGDRLDLFPYISFPIETASYFIRPQLGYRYTTYDLQHLQYAPTLTDKSPDRGVPIFSLDTGLVFERSMQFGDSAWTQTLEPRAYYLRVPYRNQDDLPIFDTQEIPFSFGELFRTNRFVGADRQMDANNLSLALTTRFLEDATGEERIAASIGEIRYFDDQRVQVPNVPRTDFGGSTYAGELDFHINDRWRVTLDQQWNPNTDRTDLSAVTLQNRFGGNGILNLSYRYRRDFLEQVDVSTLVPVTDSWRLIARWNYALNNPLALPTDPHGTGSRTLERFFGFEHDTCCVAFRVIARHWIHNAEGDADNAVYFEIEFKGIGSFGQTSDDFLRRGILGYQ